MKLSLWSPRLASPFVCSNCLPRLNRRLPSFKLDGASKRLYATTKAPPPPPAAGYTSLPSRQIISLVGPDATKFLQGIITANLSPSTPRTSGFYTAFLTAQGRLLNDAFIYPKFQGSDIEGWYIEVDTNEVELLAKRLKRYKLRSKFEIKVVSQEELRIWSIWDSIGEGWTAHSLSGSGESGREGKKDEISCEDKRAPGMGRRLVLPGNEKPEVDMEETTQDAYQIRRYLKGVPEGQDELIKEHALPQESNIDFMGGIDYRKGCYIGQELTIRTHHTGVIRKRVLPVMIYGKDEQMPEVLDYIQDNEVDAAAIPRETNFGRAEKKGRSAGKWLSGVGNLGLGLCRLEIMTDTVLQGEAGGFKEGDEFKLEWEVEGGGNEMVKVKAFIPPWHLTRQ